MGEPVFTEELRLEAAVSGLDRVLDWMGEWLEGQNCAAKTANQIAVAVEELFVNIASYAYPGAAGEVVIRRTLQGGDVVIQFEDSGVVFNPLTQGKPDLEADIESRPVGGLGIYLILKMTDSQTYHRLDGKNVMTLRKAIHVEGEK